MLVFSTSDIFTLQNKGIFFNGVSDFSSGIAGINSGTEVRIFAGGSERVRVDDSGNVGIGTGIPNALGFLETGLNIAAGSSSSTTLQQAGLVVSGSSDANDADDFGYLSFTNYQSTLSADRVAEIRINKAGSNVNTGKFHFYTANGTALNESMVLGETGLLRLNQYGAGTLVSDALGNITVSSGGGAGGPYLPLAGGTMTGTIIQNGGNIDFSDGRSANFGNGDDLQIYHTGNDSYIKDAGTGDLRIVASATKIYDADMSHFQASFTDGGSVDLYYGGNKKFETTSTGITVTGASSRFNVDSSTASAIDIGYYSSVRTIRAIETGGNNLRPLAILSQNFSVDSSGNGTFAGTGTFGSTLTVNTANSNIFTLNRTTSSGGYMRFQNDGTDKLYIGSRATISASGGTGYDIYAVGGNDIRFFPGTLLALTLDTSANATFAGIVETNKIFVAKGQNLAHTPSSIKISQESTAKSQIRFYGANTSTAGILEFVGSTSNGSASGARLTINADGSSTFAGNVTLSGQTAPQLFLNSNTAGTPNYTLIANASSEFIIGRAGVSNDFILNSGNATFAGSVGVGTSSASSFYPGTNNLVAGSGSGESAISVYSASSSTGYLLFADGTSSSNRYAGQVRYNHSTNAMEFAVNNSSTAKLTISSSGNATFAATSSAFTVIARDNLFVDAGQLYIGADDGSTDNSYRQTVSTSAGSFTLQKRISGTFTDILSFNNSNNATFSGNISAQDLLLPDGADIASGRWFW